MQRILRNAIIGLCALVWLVGAEAKTTLMVDNTNIYVDTPFMLTITSTTTSQFPLKAKQQLTKDFTFIGQSTGQIFRSINGKSTKQYQWTFQLLPKKALKNRASVRLVIPSLNIGNDKTKAVTLHLRPLAKRVLPNMDRALLFKASLSPTTGVVEQQYILTLSLYRTPALIPRITQMGIRPFKIKNATVLPIKNQDSENVRLNGQLYEVIHQRFIVYPDTPGTLHVPAILLSADITQQNKSQSQQQLFSGFMNNPFAANIKTVRVSSAPIKFIVKPKLSQVSPWLPAKGLTLKVSYEGLNSHLNVGDLITRTLTLRANGLSHDRLPNLKTLNIAGLNVYPNKPILHDEFSMHGVIGVIKQKEAFMANKAGKFVLPGITIHWYNTEKKRVEVAKIMPKTLNFVPAAPTRSRPSGVSNITATPPLKSEGRQAFLKNGWVWLLVLLIASWLFMFFIWWRSKNQAQHRRSDGPLKASTPLDLHEQPKTLNAAKKAIEAACRAGDPMAVKSALIAFAALKWPENKCHHLADIAKLVNDELKTALLALESVLYGNKAQNWKGSDFWEIFCKSRLNPKQKKPKGRGDPLDPLYLHRK